MNQFREMKGIKREFSVSKTPQQNRVAERKNRTLIEAARTMLADSKLPTTFEAKVVNTAYHLGKFDRKANEGFFIGHSTNSKAFRVFNSRTRIVEENMHVKFSKNTPNIVGSGPNWLFDIDVLTKSMNYKLVVAGINLMVVQDNVNSTNRVNVVSLTVNAASNEVYVVGRKLSIKLLVDLNMPELEDISIFKDSNEDVFGAKVDLNNLESNFQGHTQEEGIDYDEIFAPVTRIEAVRLFLAYTLFKDFIVYQMDVKSVFLYEKIQEEVYVCQPLGFEDPDFLNKVYKVEKALYGLHQAPRAWYETLATYLLDNGFQRGMIDKILFIKRDKSDILLDQLYVDDIIFRSTRKKMCTEFEKMMHKKFQMSSMGELIFFLGLQVKQREDGIFISQDKYMNEILNKFGYSNVKTASTPMETHKTLLNDEKGEDVDEHLYRSMIVSLMYVTSSRHDIMSASNVDAASLRLKLFKDAAAVSHAKNKPNIDNLDIDDPYNNLKVYEAYIKGSSGSSSNSHNVAFVSAESIGSTNELNAAYSVSTATCHSSQAQEEEATDFALMAFTSNPSSFSSSNSEAEAVNTVCYVLNRALVTKHHHKTPYEILNGRSHRLDFMRPVGCPVTILNTLDPLGKFKGNQTDKNAGPQDTNSNRGTQDNVDASQEHKDATGSKTVVEPVYKEDQAYKDELDMLMSQEKEASDAANSLSKEFEQGCMTQRGAAKAGSTNNFNTISNPVTIASTS
nr:retrovirus-related Pol polyprotein from transposon TNT 1-94 [Tanacetum cinerariifolium]